MRIALFSDIHANLPALEAFFKDVDARKVDQLYCLDDLVGYNIWPNEVIQEIRKRNIPTIAGNYDFVGFPSFNHNQTKYPPPISQKPAAIKKPIDFNVSIFTNLIRVK